MTRTQLAALTYIAHYIEANGMSPSFKEIGDELGVPSKSNVHRILTALEKAGRIRRTKHRSRTIEIVEPGEVKLNAEIFRLVQDYAKQENIEIDTAANELLRQSLGAAA